ncbi:putative DNA-binding domain-containing protein [Vibrio sp. ZSDE26]|uniref:DNA-binding domain-containing protein n=1 Tax=Vibrio amylolyticus TaxID=2847292 RepID=A0A9X2BN30_9VIBR|nr:DNA-binding domain-containing protein [Vibrio amylolyticus]MCK6265523.1 putative DNA-binding domain-containing protein [Vibrio amylolyticus]
MNTSLAQVQQQFAKALHYQATGEECQIVSDHFSADERIQIYRNNFIISLSEVLEATYPMTLELVGEECFTQLSRQHVLSQPLQSGDVTHYGAAFSDTIEQFPTVLEAAPYLAEVARFEWSLDKAQQAFSLANSSISVQPLANLAQLTSDEYSLLRFHLAPSVIPFASRYALFSLNLALQNEQLEHLDINAPETGVIACHPNGVPWNTVLDSEQHQLLMNLQAESTLAEIDESLLTHLETLIQLNLVVGFTITKHEEEHHE